MMKYIQYILCYIAIKHLRKFSNYFEQNQINMSIVSGASDCVFVYKSCHLNQILHMADNKTHGL